MTQMKGRRLLSRHVDINTAVPLTDCEYNLNMTNVTFEEEGVPVNRRPVRSAGGAPAWVVAHSNGMVKNETQASVILVAFVVFSVFVCYVILSSQTGTEAVIEAPAGYEVVRPQNAPPRLAPIRQ